jgi:glycosyltransferase involved in cell wall biosynthesis
MNCDYFDLGVNTKEYYLINTKPRNKIFFYARPVTPRRGFELGVLALSIFQKEHPEYEIIFVGWDISPYKIPFKYKNLGIQTPTALNKLYNECAAGLVISFTNMSLLPLEMLAAGCRPVMNLAEHTKSVSYAKELVYSEPSPQMLADNLYRALKDSNESKIKSMSDFTKQYEWDDSNKKIEEILLEDFKSR